MGKIRQSVFYSDKENKAIDLVSQAKKSIKDARDDSQLGLSIYQTMLAQVKQITGRRQVTYKSVFNLDDRKLSFLINTLERFMEHPQATRTGREEIFEKGKKTFTQNTGWNEKEVNRLYDFFATDVYHKLLEAGYISSDDMIDLSLSDRSESDIEQALVAISTSKKDLKKLSTLDENSTDRVDYILKFLDTNISKKGD